VKISCYYRLVLLLLSALLLSPPLARAGENPPEQGAQAGREAEFTIGLGTASIPEGKYQPLLMTWRIGRELKKYFPRLGELPGRLTAFLEPQLNPSHRPEDSVEFGLGIGVQYRYAFTERVAGYLFGSTGPHYMTLVTAEQAQGFLFSNTLGAGLYYFLREDSALNLGYRYRHLSNAGLVEPNGGINASFITLGYAIFF